MNSRFDNVLKPKNTNEEPKIVADMSKRRRSEDEENKQGSNSYLNHWNIHVNEDETDDMTDMGVGMLDADELCLSNESPVISFGTDSNEEFSTGSTLSREEFINHNVSNSTIVKIKEEMLPVTESKCATSDLDDSIPSCSYTSPDCAVLKATNNSRTLMRDCKEIDDFYLFKKQPFFDSSRLDVISKLSDEVILQILKWLPKASLMRCSLVSKRFCRLCRDESLWTRLDLSCRSLYKGALGQVLSRQVVVLRLSQAEIEEPSILPLTKAFNENFESKLQYLDLSMVSVSQDTLAMIFKRCKLLKKVSLENVPVTETVCQYMSQNEDLEVLNMCMVKGLTLTCMQYILRYLRKLKELNLGWTHLDNETLNYVCFNLPSSLSRLNLAGCRKTLLDKNVNRLVTCCPYLRELDLSDCTTLTMETIEIILRLENLNFLALSRCYSISPSAFKRLKLMPSLSYLDIHGHMSEQALKLLKETFGEQLTVNKFMFSSVARPTVGIRRTSIWNIRVRD